MKKVININFQGQVIAIEETAYELLKQYIESLKQYFSREEGGEEIVNDIENRIAELFGNRLKLGINCITDEDVDSIITSIGRPEDFDPDYQETDYAYDNQFSSRQAGESEHADQSESAKSDEPRTLYRNQNDNIIAGVCSGLAHYFKIDPVWVRIAFVLLFSVLFWVYLILWIVLKPRALETNVAKRIYRNPNDRFLGGVCGGIAAYFKVDSWIPRLIFAAPLLLNLMGMISFPFFPWNRIFDNVYFSWNINLSVVIVYAVLWVIIPRANTVKQKLEMMGEEEYIKSIRETVSDNVASVKNKADEGDSYTKSYAANRISDDEGKVVEGTMPPEPPRHHALKTGTSAPVKSGNRGCFNALGVLFKIIFFAFAGIFAVAMIGVFIAFLVAGAKFVPLKSLFIDQGYENTMLWLSLALLFAVPVISTIVWIVRRSMKAKSRPVIGVASIILWVVGIFSVIMLGFKVAEKFSVESSFEQVQTLSVFNGDKLYVDMADYPSDYYSLSRSFGAGPDLNNFPYYTVNEDTLLFSNIEIQVVQSQDSLFYIRTIASSSGKDLKVAKRNTEQFAYPVQQKDSLLLLPEFFSTPVSQGFRLQGMIVEIAVPTGKKIEIDDRLDDYDGISYRSLPKNKRRIKRSAKPLNWDYGEEYILENGDLNKTVALTDSI